MKPRIPYVGMMLKMRNYPEFQERIRETNGHKFLSDYRAGSNYAWEIDYDWHDFDESLYKDIYVDESTVVTRMLQLYAS